MANPTGETVSMEGGAFMVRKWFAYSCTHSNVNGLEADEKFEDLYERKWSALGNAM